MLHHADHKPHLSTAPTPIPHYLTIISFPLLMKPSHHYIHRFTGDRLHEASKETGEPLLSTFPSLFFSFFVCSGLLTFILQRDEDNDRETPADAVPLEIGEGKLPLPLHFSFLSLFSCLLISLVPSLPYLLLQVRSTKKTNKRRSTRHRQQLYCWTSVRSSLPPLASSLVRHVTIHLITINFGSRLSHPLPTSSHPSAGQIFAQGPWYRETDLNKSISINIGSQQFPSLAHDPVCPSAPPLLPLPTACSHLFLLCLSFLSSCLICFLLLQNVIQQLKEQIDVRIVDPDNERVPFERIDFDPQSYRLGYSPLPLPLPPSSFPFPLLTSPPLPDHSYFFFASVSDLYWSADLHLPNRESISFTSV